MLTPRVKVIGYSFQNWNLLRLGNINWIGFRNYMRAFENPDFLRILWNTLVLSLSVVVITFVLGMAFALLLNRPFRGQALARTLLISPAGIVAESVGWPTFFLLSAVAALPGIALLWWLGARGAIRERNEAGGG